jgi:signal transduction histidine kinase
VSANASAQQVPRATPVPVTPTASDRSGAQPDAALAGARRRAPAWAAPLGRALATVLPSRKRSLELAVAAERRRVARELHDGVAQDLAFIVSQSKRLTRRFPDEPSLRRIAAAAERALADSRMTIYGLARPRPQTLAGAVRDHAEAIAERAGLQLTLEASDDVETSPEIEHAVLRIVSEAVSNVARHADATMLLISVSTTPDGLRVRVADDGCGFDPAEVTSSETSGFGLVSMDERARSIGGELMLESRTGGGTVLELRVP